MDTRKLVRTAISAGISALGVGLLVAGCGGFVHPGEYRIYKVDLQKATKDAGCFFQGPDANTASDSDSWLSSTTWVITTDTSNNVFLDTGDGTLQGAKNDSGGYTFDAKTVDVDFVNDDPTMTKTTSTVDTRVDFTVDGKSIGGTVVITSTVTCDGAQCPPGVDVKCVSTSKFSATQVDEVELQYGVK